MKYRIREERYGMGSSKFYTERWHEPYEQWVKAMNCEFYNLSDAKEGLDLYHKNYMSCSEPSEAEEIIHKYFPTNKIKESNKGYSNVVGNDIYNHYGIFFWQTCWFCDKEFRREAGYRFQVQMNQPWVYSCSDCSCSKSHCNDNVKVHMLNMRKGYVPAPPPMRP